MPLIGNHSWWDQIDLIGTVKNLFSDHSEEYALRGFRDADVVEPVEIELLGEADSDIQEIPKDSMVAIKNIAELCRQNGIKLVFLRPLLRRNGQETIPKRSIYG